MAPRFDFRKKRVPDPATALPGREGEKPFPYLRKNQRGFRPGKARGGSPPGPVRRLALELKKFKFELD